MRRPSKTKPKQIFWEDHSTEPRKWRAKGDRAIHITVANEYLINGAMYKYFGKYNLNTREVICSQTNMRGSKTYFK